MFNLGNAKKSALATKNIENNYDYDEESYTYDENIKNDSHIAVIRQIKNDSTVLDVGCASGVLGSIIVKYKNCIVDGIEYDKKACEVTRSKKVYRNIFNFSISDVRNKDYNNFMKKKRKYDYIIFADVLEHLVEPWNALVNVSSLLNKNGKIVISLPNIAHIDIIKGLINHEFNYERWGILDKTHLRFFTPSSFNDMINNIADEYKVYFNVDKKEDILIKPDYFNDFEKFALFNINSNLEEYLVIQNIYVLTLVNEKKKMISNVVNNDINNFDKMIKQFNDLIKNNNKLQKENNDFRKEYSELQNKYNQIVNSKRWKIINRIANIFHR